MRNALTSRLSNFLAIGALAALPVSTDSCENMCEVARTDLVVAGEDVGDVTVWSDGTFLTVVYDVSDPHWNLDATHLYVGRTAPESDASGQYPYAHHDLFENNDRYDLSLKALGATPKTHLYIAAEADLSAFGGFDAPSLDSFAERLPDGAVVAHYASEEGNEITLSGGDELDGTWAAWSVATDGSFLTQKANPMLAISSYDKDFEDMDLVYLTGNMDSANWVLNEYQVGQMMADGRVLSRAELQAVYWWLLDGDAGPQGPDRVSEEHVNEIFVRALLEGDGFEPGCFDKVAVVLEPVVEGRSTSMIAVGFSDMHVLCRPIFESEHAWAEGTEPLAHGDASYFEYSCY